MAHVSEYQHRPGWWRVRVSTGKDPDTGKYRRKSFLIEAPNRREAEARAVLLEAEHTRNPYRGTPPTFRTLVDQWWDADPNGNEQATRVGYRSKKDRWVLPHLGDIPLAELNPGHIEDWMNDLTRKHGLAPSTANQCYTIVRQACMYGLRRRMLDHSPVEGLKRIRIETKKPAEPDQDDVRRLIADLEQRRPTLGYIVALAAATGARRGELLALRWTDIDFDRSTVHFRHSLNPDRTLKPTKTHGERAVPVNPTAIALLVKHSQRELERLEEAFGHHVDLQPDGFVFPSPEDTHTPRNPDSVTRSIAATVRRLGLDRVWLHGLRHISVSTLIEAGIDIRTIATRHGHADPSITLKWYATASDTQQQRAGELAGGWLQLDPG